MGFTLRDHTTDAAVEADGESLGAVSVAVADGLTATMHDNFAETGGRFSFAIRAEGHEVLLFDYLDQLIYEYGVYGVLPAAHEAIIRLEGDEWAVEASARGVPLTDVNTRDVKAVTYSEIRLAETDAGWEVYAVFDV